MAVLADRSDLVEGKASLIGIFQSVVASAFPTELHGVLAIRVAMDADEADWVEVSAELRRDGTALGDLSMSAFVPPATPSQPLRGIDVTVDLEGTELPQPGLYTFEIAVDGRPIATVPLSVLRLGPAAHA